MNPLTKQQVFDKVWDRFVIKRKPLSFIRIKPTNFIYTQFYGSDSARDPIGMFIPEENYCADWMDESSGCTVYSFLLGLKVRGLDKEPWTQIFFQHESLFEDLEKAHDDVARFIKPYKRLGVMRGKLIGVAKKHKLKYV